MNCLLTRYPIIPNTIYRSVTKNKANLKMLYKQQYTQYITINFLAMTVPPKCASTFLDYRLFK